MITVNDETQCHLLQCSNMIELTSTGKENISYRYGLLIDSHSFYKNKRENVYFLNIPKNASTFIDNSLRKIINSNKNNKIIFSLIRDPYQRFLSFVTYSELKKYEIEKLLIGLSDNNHQAVFDIMKDKEEVNFLPQTFYIKNAPTLWQPVQYFWSMDYLNHFDIILENMGLHSLNKKHIPQNMSSNQKLYEFTKDLITHKYNNWFLEFYHDDILLYDKVVTKTKQLLNV